MSESEKLNLNQWLPATVLNESDLDGLTTDILVISARERGQEFAIMEMIDPQYRNNRPLNCLVRVTSHTDPIVGPPSVSVTPVELLLDNLYQWGVIPRPDEKKES